jgi:hypothetical protein
MRIGFTIFGIAALVAHLCPGRADGLVLTGLSRQGGIERAYFNEPAGRGSFSLDLGADSVGERLIEVNFPQGWVLVANQRGTNRVEFAKTTKGPLPSMFSGVTTRAQNPVTRLFRPAEQPKPRLPAGTAQSISTGVEGMAQFEVEPASTAVPNPAGSTESNGLLSGSQEPPSASPRPPTADELYRARNGNAAFENMMRQRHDAEVLAARAAGIANP